MIRVWKGSPVSIYDLQLSKIGWPAFLSAHQPSALALSLDPRVLHRSLGSQCSGIAALTYNASWHLGIGSQCGGITACNYNALWHCGNSLLMPAWHICSRASRTRHENLAYEERRNTSLILLKGQCREIFEPFFPLKDSTWAPI